MEDQRLEDRRFGESDRYNEQSYEDFNTVLDDDVLRPSTACARRLRLDEKSMSSSIDDIFFSHIERLSEVDFQRDEIPQQTGTTNVVQPTSQLSPQNSIMSVRGQCGSACFGAQS